MGKPRFESRKHHAAFEYYYAIGLDDPKDRSLLAVSKRFGVTDVAARNWSAAFKWHKRIEERERLVAHALAEKAIEDEVRTRKRNLGICAAVKNAFIQELKANKVKPGVADFAAIAKLEQLLHGKPTERSEVKFQGVVGHLMASVINVLETTIPDRCPHCREELDLRNTIAGRLTDASQGIGGTDGGGDG